MNFLAANLAALWAIAVRTGPTNKGAAWRVANKAVVRYGPMDRLLFPNETGILLDDSYLYVKRTREAVAVTTYAVITNMLAITAQMSSI